MAYLDFNDTPELQSYQQDLIMEKRTFVNPAINDAATFIETSEETKGAYTLIEIVLGKSDGPPLHYHNKFSEKFECVEGVLYVQVQKSVKKLNIGESVTVPAGTAHRFFNKADDPVRFHITLVPGSTGMENFIKIFYGLATDGLTDKKGKPKNFAHLAVALTLSDSNASGWMSLLSPIIRMEAKRAKKNGTEQWLLDKYCS
jgi:quercetin dioxygenase-like cupin family protein